MLRRRDTRSLLYCLLVLPAALAYGYPAWAAPPGGSTSGNGDGGGVSASPPDWIQLDGGPSYKFTEPGGPAVSDAGSSPPRNSSDNRVVLRLPVLLKPRNPQKPDLNAQTVAVKLTGARFDDSANQSLFDAFRGSGAQDAPHLDDGHGKTGPALQLSLDLNDTARQGTYAVTLEASAPHYPARSFTVQIVHSPAVLNTPATLIIDREIEVWGSERLRTTPLLLQEKGGLSGLSPVVLVAKNFTDAQGAPVIEPAPSSAANAGGFPAAALSFPSPPARIPPNGSATLPYTLHGDFPWGATKGVVEISAPQLVTVPVPVEIRTHRTTTWILILTVIGLALGWVVRTYLQQRIQANQTRLKAIDLAERMHLMQKQHPDSLFVAKVGPPLDALVQALEANRAAFWRQFTAAVSADPLVAAIQTADDALAGALTDLDSRRVTVKSRLEEFANLTRTPWLVPEAVRAALVAVQKRNEEHAQRKWSHDDVEGARQDLQQSRGDLITGINNAWSAWKVDAKQRIQELSASSDALPAAVTLSLKPLLAALTPLVDAIGAISPEPKPDMNDIAAALGAMHNVEINVRDILREIAGWVQSVRTDVVETLLALQADLPDIQAAEALDAAARQWIGSLLAEAERSGPTLNPLAAEGLRGLGTAWQEAIRKQITELPAEAQADIDALLKKQQYGEAARAVAVGIENRKTAIFQSIRELSVMRVMPSETSAETPSVGAFLTAWFARRESVAPSSVLALSLRASTLPTPIAVTRAQTMRELMAESLLQFVIVGILIAVVGYGLFADKFVGTISDMLGIFFWAFGLNITVDALLTAAKPKP